MARDFIKRRKNQKQQEAKKDAEANELAFENSRVGLLSLAKLDFAVHTLYVRPGSIHTRTDGSTGVYIKLKTFDNLKLGFVPISNVKSTAESLKKQIPKLIENADHTDSQIKAIQTDLEMFDEDWDLAKKVKAQAEIQQLEHKLTVQRSLIEKKRRILKHEEEKGICIRYSLVHSEGRILQKDDIWENDVRISKRELKEEAAQIVTETEKIKLNTINALQKLSVVTRQTESESKMVDELQIEQAKRKIQENVRGNRSEIKVF